MLFRSKLLSPLIVWNNTLVDGHNRYAILQKHPEIYFSTMPLRFENREEAVAWICRCLLYTSIVEGEKQPGGRADKVKQTHILPPQKLTFSTKWNTCLLYTSPSLQKYGTAFP